VQHPVNIKSSLSSISTAKTDQHSSMVHRTDQQLFHRADDPSTGPFSCLSTPINGDAINECKSAPDLPHGFVASSLPFPDISNNQESAIAGYVSATVQALPAVSGARLDCDTYIADMHYILRLNMSHPLLPASDIRVILCVLERL
jgi:hypothetical protein